MGLSDAQHYANAAHAMQTGVLFEMQHTNSSATTPKHLRVGVNSAMVAAEALATLLIEKGVFTLEEYTKANADAMEREVARYEARAPEGIHFS